MCRWIFSQWAIKELFVDQKDNVREWIFRSNLDRYVSMYNYTEGGFIYHNDFREVD